MGAPSTAQEIANEMAKAAPDLEHTTVSSGESDEVGEIIVISNAGDDPKLACFKALALLDRVPDSSRWKNWGKLDIWKSASLEMKNWGKHLDIGFNKDDADDDSDLEDDADAGLLAITKVMAERLTGHFRFEPSLVCRPVIYGGYAADGSIVGVLSAGVFT